MDSNTQARALARMKSTYALGCAALLFLYCIPHSAGAQLEPTASLARANPAPPQTSSAAPPQTSNAAPPQTASAAAANLSAGRSTASASLPTAMEGAAHSGGLGVVNINTAGAAELERLPRIGPARALAILALRAKLKQFSRVEQLLQVKGIGRATFRMLRPLLALSGPTTLEHKRGR